MAQADVAQCPSKHEPVQTALSVFLLIGLVVSYLPQIARIIIKKSSLGFSPWFLLLGATSSASSFLNVVALQWGLVRCCAVVSASICAESLLGIAQVGLQWLMFVCILALFLVYYPKELRYERAITLPGRTRRPGLGANEDDASSVNSSEDWSEDVEDLDSMDSHIEQNYSNVQSASGFSAVGSSGFDGTPTQSAVQRFTDEELREASEEASSSAFARLVPSFWPMWKAPASAPGTRATAAGPPGRQTASGSYAGIGVSGAKNTAIPSVKPPATAGSSGATPEGSSNLSVPQQRHTRPPSQSAVRAWKKAMKKNSRRRSAEWSLSIALAWVVAIHFVFVFLITLLLVGSLPDSSFPDPNDPAIPAPIPRPPAWLSSSLQVLPASAINGSRVLVQRWAALLGLTGTALAAGQYIPQIIYTARAKLVGSLSIPMMCLQVPGSVIFVYSLAIRPGTDWSSLAAFVATGVLQLVLLILCLAWKARQNKLGIDDFGRPVGQQRAPSAGNIRVEED